MASHGLTNSQAAQLNAKTLWIGDIEPWMDETHIQSLFQGIASITQVKLIRDKLKNTPVGYGFVEFPNYEIAKNVYMSLNNTNIPGTQRSFKLNWASHGTKDQLDKIQQQQPQQQTIQSNQPGYMQPTPQGDYQIYVGNLDQNVNNTVLLNYFSKKFDSLIEAKVISDPVTKISKGYGFLRFSSQLQAVSCLNDCNGHYIMTKPIKLNNAAQRRSQGDEAPQQKQQGRQPNQFQPGSQQMSYQGPQGAHHLAPYQQPFYGQQMYGAPQHLTQMPPPMDYYSMGFQQFQQPGLMNYNQMMPGMFPFQPPPPFQMMGMPPLYGMPDQYGQIPYQFGVPPPPIPQIFQQQPSPVKELEIEQVKKPIPKAKVTVQDLEKKYGLQPKTMTEAERERAIDRLNEQYLDRQFEDPEVLYCI